MTRLQEALGALVFSAFVAAIAHATLSDAQVRERIVQESLASYPGNCPCPYNTDRAGRSCGARSAWSKAGGYSPICYESEVTPDQVREWRARNDT
jgi:hypothetical protein